MKLIIEDDEGRRSVVPIDLGEATVGRDEANTIRLNERNVSRRHARLVRENGTIFAEDLDSYNGVFINGDRVKSRQDVHEGDILKVGDFQLELRGEGMSRRTEETTQRAGPPEGAEVTRPSIRLDDPANGNGQLHGYEELEPEEPRHEPTAIIRVDQMQERGRRRDSQTIAGQRARLLCVSTQFAGREFEIDREEAVIGRTEDNDIAVDHRSVSRHHAKIIVSGNAYRIIDMKSANGTLVNGEEYAQIELKSGDLIELGHVKFRFVPPGEHYVHQPDELAAINKAPSPPPRPSSPPPLDDPAPVSEYVPPREVTNPGVGANSARNLVEPKSSNALLYVGLGIVVVLLAAVLGVLLQQNGEAPVTPVTGVGLPEATDDSALPGIKNLEDRMADAVIDKDWNSASEAAASILARVPEHDRALRVQRKVRMEMEAAVAFEKAIEFNAESDWAGVVTALDGIPEDSALHDQAVKMRAKAQEKLDSSGLGEEARSAIDDGRYDEADALIDELAQRDPDEADTLRDALADARRPKSARSTAPRRTTPKTVTKPTPKVTPKPKPEKAAKPEETEEADEKAAAQTPAAKAREHLRTAIALVKDRQFEAALEPLQACVKENARNCKCFRTLGIAHANLKNSEKAARAYRSYIELCPNQPDVPQVKKMLGIE